MKKVVMILGMIVLFVMIAGTVLATPWAETDRPVLYPGCTYLPISVSPFNSNTKLPRSGDMPPEHNAPPCKLWTLEPSSTPSVINPTPTQYAETSTPHKVAVCLVSPNKQETKFIDWHAVEDWLRAHPGSYRGECVEPTSTPEPFPTAVPTHTPAPPPPVGGE